MDWMGVLPQVQAARTHTEVIALVRDRGRPVEAPAEMLSESVSERHIGIMHGDLAKILYEAAHGQVEYVFDDSIATVHDDVRRSRLEVPRLLTELDQAEDLLPRLHQPGGDGRLDEWPGGVGRRRWLLLPARRLAAAPAWRSSGSCPRERTRQGRRRSRSGFRRIPAGPRTRGPAQSSDRSHRYQLHHPQVPPADLADCTAVQVPSALPAPLRRRLTAFGGCSAAILRPISTQQAGRATEPRLIPCVTPYECRIPEVRERFPWSAPRRMRDSNPRGREPRRRPVRPRDSRRPPPLS